MSPRSALERLLSTTNNAVRPTLCTSSFCTSSSSSARLYSTSNTSNTSTPSTPSTRPPGSRLYSPPTSYLTQHIHQLLAPLNLPTLHDDVIQQALTHKSAVNKARNLTANSEGARAHGERLAFVGRRVLRMHYTMHLNSSLHASHPDLHAQYLSSEAVDLALETKELGSNVGRVWGLEKALRWREVRGQNGAMTGLYKSRGAAVEALAGAVYTQNGIAASAAFFEQLVLPNLALPPKLASALRA